MHLTQVALGANPAKGAHVVYITKEDGEKIAICTLESDRFPHTSINITVATGAISLSHTGNSDVFVSGYRTTSLSLAGLDDEEDYPFYMDGKPISLLAGEGDSDSEDDESSSEEEESSDDDDDAAPMAVKIPGGAGSSEEEEEFSDDEEEEEEAEDSKNELGLVDLEAAAEDTGDDSDFDDDDLEEAEEEDEESSDDDEEEEEEEIDLGAIIKGAGKRINNNQTKTPQPAQKKHKAEKKPPATAPAKTAAVLAAAVDTEKKSANSDKNADGVKEFESGLAAYLKLKGPTKLSVLGQFVPRPKEGPKIKMKPFLNDRKAKFSYDEKTDLVSLAE